MGHKRGIRTDFFDPCHLKGTLLHKVVVVPHPTKIVRLKIPRWVHE